MPAVRYSRYEYANVEVDEQGRTFLDVPEPLPREALFRGADRVLVLEGDTLWSVAWKKYKALLDPEQDLRPTSFWDVIGEANDIIDPLAPLEPGTFLVVPSIEVLLTELRAPPPFFQSNNLT